MGNSTSTLSNQEAANRIVEAMVLKEHVSAHAVKEATGVSQKGAKALAQDVENDGAVDKIELKKLKKIDKSKRLVKIAKLIGDRPRKLFQIARIFGDVRWFQRCDKIRFGTDQETYLSSDQCAVTLEGTTEKENKAITKAITEFETMLKNGDDVMPAFELFFSRERKGIAYGILSIVDLSLLPSDQREIIAKKILSDFIITDPSPYKALKMIQTLKQLESEGKEKLPAVERIVKELNKTESNWKLNPEWVKRVFKEL